MREEMLKRSAVHICMLFADAVLTGFFFFLATLHAQHAVSLRYVLWIPELLLVYAVNVIFQAKRCTLRLTVAVDAVLILLTGASTILVAVGRFEDIDAAYLLLILFLAGTALHAAMLPAEELKEASLPLYADGLLVTLVLTLALSGSMELPGGDWQIPWNIAALALILAALVLRRTQKLNPGLFLMPLLFILMTGAAASAAFLLQGGGEAAVRGILFLWHVLVRILYFSARLLYRFLLWINSFLPVPQYEEAAPLPEEELILPGEEEAMEMPLYVLVIGGIAAVILLFILLRFICRALKGLRWNEAAFGQPSAGTVRTNRLKEALRALFGRIAAALSFELCYLRNRNTAEGLLTYAERRCAGPGKKELKRRTGESDAAFLRRIRPAGMQEDLSEGAPEPGECFEKLASLLERRTYGNAGEEVSAEFCRRFRAALRRVR